MIRRSNRFVFILSSLLFLIFCISCASIGPQREDLSFFASGVGEEELGPAYTFHSPEEFGPTSGDKKVSSNPLKKKDPVVAVSFGPSLNRVDAQIAFLKVLEKHKIRPQVLTGVEMGAVVAALYAMTKSAEKLEWYFYKFFRNINKVVPYSNKWLSIVKSDLLDSALRGQCSKVKLESLKSFLFIPLYNRKTKEIEYRSSGNLCNLLIQNLDPYPSQKTNYISAMQWTAFMSEELKGRGVDFVIGVDALDGKVDLKTPDGTLLGIFLQAQSRVTEEAKLLDYFVALPASEALLDSTEDLALIGRKSMEHTESIVSELLFEIQNQ